VLLFEALGDRRLLGLGLQPRVGAHARLAPLRAEHGARGVFGRRREVEAARELHHRPLDLERLEGAPRAVEGGVELRGVEAVARAHPHHQQLVEREAGARREHRQLAADPAHEAAPRELAHPSEHAVVDEAEHAAQRTHVLPQARHQHLGAEIVEGAQLRQAEGELHLQSLRPSSSAILSSTPFTKALDSSVP
jgi:hypothetical protein